MVLMRTQFQVWLIQPTFDASGMDPSGSGILPVCTASCPPETSTEHQDPGQSIAVLSRS